MLSVYASLQKVQCSTTSLVVEHWTFLSPYYFALLKQIDSQNVKISLSDCHPGYTFNGVTCECENNRRQIVRCDGQQRYFYVQVNVITLILYITYSGTYEYVTMLCREVVLSYWLTNYNY